MSSSKYSETQRAAMNASQGWNLLASKDYWGAIAACTAAIEVAPGTPWPYRTRAEAYKRLGMKEEAEADLEHLARASELAQHPSRVAETPIQSPKDSIKLEKESEVGWVIPVVFLIIAYAILIMWFMWTGGSGWGLLFALAILVAFLYLVHRFGNLFEVRMDPAVQIDRAEMEKGPIKLTGSLDKKEIERVWVKDPFEGDPNSQNPAYWEVSVAISVRESTRSK